MKETSLPVPAEFKSRLTEEISFLKQFARKFVAETDIEDLVQDTVLKALTCFEKFKEGTNLNGWLFVLMRNIYINSYRKLNLYLKFIENNSDTNFANDTCYWNGGEEKLMKSILAGALEKLRPGNKIPFELFIEGYKYHEIASKLKVPIGTIKTRIYVARNELKTSLNVYQVR